MIKRYFLSLITCTCFYLLAASFTSKNGNYEVLKVTAPFPMQPIKVFIYPDKDFIITDFGAVNGGRVDNTKAITSAIEACNQSGGGRVVVPAGTWLTGPIHCSMLLNVRTWRLQVKGLFSRRWIPGKYGSNVLSLIWKH